jgi:hypothetical protein
MNVMEMLEKEQMRGDIPDFNTGPDCGGSEAADSGL